MTRIVPELTKTGPSDTVKAGDDFIEPVKVTFNSFLRSMQVDPDTGNKYRDDAAYVDFEFLESLADGTFERLNPDEYARLRRMIDANTESGITQGDILRHINGSPQTGSPITLPSIETNEAARVVLESTSAVLKTNRFSPDNMFVTDGRMTSVPAVMPASLGQYDQHGAPVVFDELTKVGMSLMLRATGEFIEGDPTSPGVSLASLLPGQAQLGIKVDSRSLRADDVYGAPGGSNNVGVRRRSRIADILGTNVGSHGQLNSFNEPFDGFMPIGMVGLAVILIIALRLVTQLFLLLFSLMAGIKPGQSAQKQSVEPLVFGQYGRQSNAGNAIITLADIGIIQLDRDFTIAANVGIKVFFDFNGTSFRRVVRSPGFYANMIRIIIQSGARVITSVVEAFKKFSTGGPVAGVQSMLGIIDILKSSKIVAFLNIIAMMGDRAMAEDESGASSAPRRSLVDGLPSNPQTRQSKSSELTETGTQTLAWRGSSAPSALIVPRSVKIAAAGIGYAESRVGTLESLHGSLLGPTIRAARLSGNGLETSRLSQADVQVIETHLDAEYTPFYFHDIRTNEFLGFHAFIASVDETYTPQYNETHPYGRVDPIMTYSNTTRTFSLAFFVVATSPADFDAMYVKLNKLTTLVYPMWTRGRDVADADGKKFVQPFSQVPGASPLVRLRLGDLFKSNFSNLALARLFGVDDEMFLSEQPPVLKTPGEADRMRQDLEKRITDDGWDKSGAQTALFSPRIPKRANAGSSFIVVPGQQSSSKEAARVLQALIRAGKGFKVKIKRAAYGTDAIDTSGGGALRGNKLYIVSPIESEYKNIELVVDHADLVLTHEDVALAVDLGGSPPPPTSAPPVQAPESVKSKFFDFTGDGNAVTRSFKNVQGKGIAGFITSLGMDWNVALENGSWETTEHGSRAPMLCKVSINFTVIHDIAPGLDHAGFNRAPVYNTGRVLNKLLGDVYDDTNSAAELHRSFMNKSVTKGQK